MASGKKVYDEVIKRVDNKTLSSLGKNGVGIKPLANEYTLNKTLFNDVNKALLEKGYTAVKDINDPYTDLPVIFLNAKSDMALKYTQSGEDAVNELLKKKYK